jgi:hypothetical protein
MPMKKMWLLKVITTPERHLSGNIIIECTPLSVPFGK